MQLGNYKLWQGTLASLVFSCQLLIDAHMSTDIEGMLYSKLHATSWQFWWWQCHGVSRLLCMSVVGWLLCMWTISVWKCQITCYTLGVSATPQCPDITLACLFARFKPKKTSMGCTGSACMLEESFTPNTYATSYSTAARMADHSSVLCNALLHACISC